MNANAISITKNGTPMNANMIGTTKNVTLINTNMISITKQWVKILVENILGLSWLVTGVMIASAWVRVTVGVKVGIRVRRVSV